MEQKFFRYQSFSARAVDALCRDKTYYANPADFNDPFDCRPSVVGDSTLEDLRDLLMAMVANRMAAETKVALKQARVPTGMEVEKHADAIALREAQELLNQLRWMSENGDDEDERSPDERERARLTHSIEKELLQRYTKGVCCFSESAVSPLLWSHYGDQHRGFCVGYSSRRRPSPDLRRVQYVNDRTVPTSLIRHAMLDHDPAAINSLDEAVLLRKATDWAYETEWRLIGKRGVGDSALRMTDVVFGMRCEVGLMFTLMQTLVLRGDMQFWRVHPKGRSYELELAQLDESYFEGRFPEKAESGEEMFGGFDGDAGSTTAV